MPSWPVIEMWVGSMIIGGIFNLGISMVYFRWKQRQELPEELHKEVVQLRGDVVALRVDLARVKGRINGKGWKLEA